MSEQQAVLPYGTDRQLQAVACSILSPAMFLFLSQQCCANMKRNTQTYTETEEDAGLDRRPLSIPAI